MIRDMGDDHQRVRQRSGSSVGAKARCPSPPVPTPSGSGAVMAVHLLHSPQYRLSRQDPGLKTLELLEAFVLGRFFAQHGRGLEAFAVLGCQLVGALNERLNADASVGGLIAVDVLQRSAV